MLEDILRKCAHCLPPEYAHDLDRLEKFSRDQQLLQRFYPRAMHLPVKAMGLHFPNPIGLAAGLDKDGRAIPAWQTMGFGFVEVGTVTPLPQSGNPKPRLFRLKTSKAIINRMGFNNRGIDALADKLTNVIHMTPVGANLGKNKQTPNEQAFEDYVKGMRAVYEHADYITINISSPNTASLRDLQAPDALGALLAKISDARKALADQHGQYRPIVIKIAPDMHENIVKSVVECVRDAKMDGLITTNTTIDHSAVLSQQHGQEQGGLSGAPLMEQATTVLKWSKDVAGDALTLIGVGGIMNAQDVLAKKAAGADLFQLYTGFIYHGTPLIRDCIQALSAQNS